MNKFVYDFTEGNKDMKNILGGKGANLAEMISIGLPVPMGFTVTTEACNKYYINNETISLDVETEIFEHIKSLENKTLKYFGNPENPLLVSVRSGARASMPGMMDTILNLGLNDNVVEGLYKITNNKRFAYDSYRRFIQMFADVVKGYPKSSFERLLDEIKNEKKAKFDTDLNAEDMVEVTDKFKQLYKSIANEDFPQDPKKQLIEAVTAVFRSWNNERAKIYRKMNDIPSSWGTAVNVQEMVYGNMGNDCGTGVAFTRNPATGENKLYGEYLINAQGEDVVAGIRTPQPISTLKEVMPEIYLQFEKIAKILEQHYRDMQDMEFTIEKGKLYMLQTRNGKRTATAAIKIAVDLVKEHMISKEEALLKVEPKQLEQLLHPNFDIEDLKSAKAIATGLAASPGAGTGKIYFDAKDISLAKKRGEDTILVRLETSPEDIQGMNDANGILTIRGGMTSHAAVVARGMGRCCICGCGDININEELKTITTKDGQTFKEGDYISLDGTTGIVYGKQIKTVDPEISGDFETFMSWADEVRKLKIRANADTPKDAFQAYKFGAEGIGLCRTEHMFFEKERIFNFRKMICADNIESREEALENILPYQRSDFEGLFRTMKSLPVVIRYLDPPLHEFLPHTDEEITMLAKSLNMSFEALKNRVTSLKEFNPMMGHRGCRLAITYPEIARMQTRAVIEAAINVKKEGINVTPEIMIPLIGDINEFKYVKNIVCEVADNIIKEENVDLKYEVGTMIEIPRAAITADKIATESEFFSFGTNDLTQLTYGFSRDDASKFLNDYYDKKIFEIDPFEKIDQEGVGELVKIAVEKGRSVRPNISLGICGEHAGETSSIEFCNRVGLDYVSCSPFRVPTARLAAAWAVINENK
jgi:pyruvate,orthophosphate dikinase